ncbi:hypothetical protein V5O48_013823, partial [Marasmius crinis-equi]
MCLFFKTLLRSEKLKDQVVAFRLRGVVSAFHGHAHNRPCQTEWHPMYSDCVGMEDFEECERMFSQSNHLASTTWLATKFHQRQAILEHFAFYDVDKHTFSGKLLLEKYHRALKWLATDVPLFEELCKEQDISEADCEGFLEQEWAHLAAAMEEDPEVSTKLDYVELLQKVTRA